jgi:hypothetical protein
MSERVLPEPPPPSSSALGGRGRISAETDFWAGLFLDLSLRVEWLGQALDAVPKEDASAAAHVRMRSYARAFGELHQAIARVQAHRSEPALKPLFALDGPLAGYLSRLYGWCATIGDDFERMAVALRGHQPTSIVFSHHAVNASFAEFTRWTEAMRRHVAQGRASQAPGEEATWRAFEEHLEEVIWSTEWVHMTIARPPGE